MGPREVPWPSKWDTFESCHIAVSKPNRNSLWGLGRGTMAKQVGSPSKAAAEGCEVLRPSEAAAEVLRLVRPAQNVPHRSFEAQ